MSQIFDGLQRSEAERSGIEPSVLPRATELLRRAELRAASKWERTALLEAPTAPKVVPEETVSAGPLPGDAPIDRFAHFRPLQVTLTPQSRVVCLTESGSPAAEAFRLLGIRLRHRRRDGSIKKVLVTSTVPQEGKSMVAANLACALAQRTEQRVLLLEGDLRRPSQSQIFGLGKNPGLNECLRGERALTASIYHLESAGFWILPAGSAPSDALELLQSGRLSELMDQVTEWFDWIVIDSPPVLPLADTSVWMRLADGILLITRQGTTEKRLLQKGLEALEPKKLIGAVLNSSRSSGNGDYYYSPATASQTNDTPAT